MFKASKSKRKEFKINYDTMTLEDKEKMFRKKICGLSKKSLKRLLKVAENKFVFKKKDKEDKSMMIRVINEYLKG